MNIDNTQQSEHNAGTARKFYDLLSQKDVDAWIELWHEDGKIIVPYPPAGFASAIEGRDTIHEAFKGLLGNFETFDSTITDVYPAVDSDAVCVEYTNHAVIKGGTIYTNTNIAVFRFIDGLISEYHDYFDPRRFQVVVDALPKA
jgi:ketosteroid isomerase-like protein